MKKEDREKLKGTIALLDQAIAPLKQAHSTLAGLTSDEEDAVDGLEDADSDKNVERREKVEELRGFVDEIEDMLEKLNQAKDCVEAY